MHTSVLVELIKLINRRSAILREEEDVVISTQTFRDSNNVELRHSRLSAPSEQCSTTLQFIESRTTTALSS